MKITIVSVGKIKEKFMREAVGEYTKRLSKYCKLSFAEVADRKAPENLSEKEEIQIKISEGGDILKKIKDTHYIVALDILGKQISSEELSEKNRFACTHRQERPCFYNWGLAWPFRGCAEKSRLQIVLFKNDLSPPAYEANPA